MESQLKTDIIQKNQVFNEYKAMDSEINIYGIGVAKWDGIRRVFLINEANKEGEIGKIIVFRFLICLIKRGEIRV